MMGAQLTSRVFAYWTHLPDRPFRLLVHMSHLVKDTNEVPTYWGGRDAMAQALGLDVGTASTHTMVKRAIKKLIDEGAIRRTFDGHAGSRSEYRLTLERGNSSVPLRGNKGDPQRGNATDPHRGNSDDPAGVTVASPQGTTIGTSEENGEEDKSRSLDKSPRGRVERRKADESRLTLVRQRADRERGAS